MALLGTTGLAATLRPVDATLPALDLERAIPLALGPYRYDSAIGLILPDSGETSQRIYDQVITRSYVCAGRLPIMLVIAYGAAQDAGLALHRPDACYPAAGYHIENATKVTLSTLGSMAIPATLLTATREDVIEHVLFWTRIGNRFPTSAAEEKLDVMQANLAGKRPDGVLVRVSVRTADREAGQQEMRLFLATTLAAITPAARARLTGAGL